MEPADARVFTDQQTKLNFDGILDDVEDNGSVWTITRGGKPLAVILPAEHHAAYLARLEEIIQRLNESTEAVKALGAGS